MKHAYLIMAHNEIEILKLLLQKLDDAKNTIYLHCDIKFKCNLQVLAEQLQYSKIIFIDRMDVKWGKYSQIQCELALLKEALKGNYDYYHLLTGTDLPLKSNDEIDAYFEKNKGTEFVAFDDRTGKEPRNYIHRYNSWHFKLNLPKNNLPLFCLIRLCNLPLRVLEIIVNCFAGNRSKKYPDITFMKGSVYFDITHALATYIVEREDEIKKMFKYTQCCDEIFLQTFAYNSPFVEHLSFFGTRYIDWSKHGSSPEYLTLKYYELLQNGWELFARKFSCKYSRELIKKLYDVEINDYEGGNRE